MQARGGDGGPAAPELPQRLPVAPTKPSTAGQGFVALSEEDVETLRTELEETQQAQERVFQLNRRLNSYCSQARNAMQYGVPERAEQVCNEVKRLLREHEATARAGKEPRKPGEREWQLTGIYENLVKVLGLQYFLRTGTSLRRAELGNGVDDEEYLGGIISMCHELAHYALRRASVLDEGSVRLCQDTISAIRAELLGFDFRNGPLRRKFDSLKYAERRCTDLLYELSFVEAETKIEAAKAEAAEQEASTTSQPLVDPKEWKLLRESYAAYDERRENVIKSCRDVQKAAKQATFAAQRGDLRKADNLIKSALEGVQQIWEEHVRDNPGLRFGAFSGGLEELAEAQLFVAWLRCQEGAPKANSECSLPRRQELAVGLLDGVEYLGALSDFTGEVGRKAVEAATRRDGERVAACVAVAFSVHALLSTVPLREKQVEKLVQTENNLRKMESIEYDLAVRTIIRNGQVLTLPSAQEQADQEDG